MKKIFIFLVLLLTNNLSFAQSTRVAILDFENISGITKYDGLGKAMSSMLISDIEANVSPKRLQLVERAQIQKVLKEQNFQASGSVNKSTAVQAGKILGVNYLLVGDVYVLNDQLIINARLTNTETGDIVFSKKQEGKTVAWLTLKTNIAMDLANSLSQPFIEPTIPDKEISVATITTFGNAVAAKDSGNVQMAETLSSTVIDFNPEFRYVDDLRKEIDELKKQVAKNTEDINDLQRSGGRVIGATGYNELILNISNILTSKNEQQEILKSIMINYPDEFRDEGQSFAGYPRFEFDKVNDSVLLDEIKTLNIFAKNSVNKVVMQNYIIARLNLLFGTLQMRYWGMRGPSDLKNLPLENRFARADEINQELNSLFNLISIQGIEKEVSLLYFSMLNSIVPLTELLNKSTTYFMDLKKTNSFNVVYNGLINSLDEKMKVSVYNEEFEIESVDLKSAVINAKNWDELNNLGNRWRIPLER